jgi:hypothetical protein
MKAFVNTICIAVFILFLTSCTSTRRFGTTIERDENNPCQINMIIQVGVQGTAEDVTKIRSELEECYNKECFIPCEPDKTKGCKTKITVVVKSWGSLNEDEQRSFHYVNMIDDDGLPSNAYIGTPNNGTSSGTWRRKNQPGVFCHEVLHFCGLPDKYCSRIYDPVTGLTRTELICDPPPDPGGDCCIPHVGNTRCSTPCAGHDHDLMATTSAPLSCENILDVLQRAGFNTCPQECCSSDKTFTRPPDEVYIIPGYIGFGDKNTKFGAIGVGIGYTKMISKSVGLTIDGGYYTHTKSENGYKDISNLLNATAGITYVPGGVSNKKGLSVSTHVLAGISNYTQKSKSPNFPTFTNSELSFHLNIGAALNLKLNKHFNIRLLQADYAPTFFYNTTQHNYRISAGVGYNIGGR